MALNYHISISYVIGWSAADFNPGAPIAIGIAPIIRLSKERGFVRVQNKSSQCRVTSAVFNLLDPLPFSFFVAVLIFDIIYARTGEMLWVKSAAWLVSLGLILAIVPRLINLAYVWCVARRTSSLTVKVDFWLNGFGIITALINAFVHSRDAYAVMPTGVWLSVATVGALALGRLLMGWQQAGLKEFGHE